MTDKVAKKELTSREKAMREYILKRYPRGSEDLFANTRSSARYVLVIMENLSRRLSLSRTDVPPLGLSTAKIRHDQIREVSKLMEAVTGALEEGLNGDYPAITDEQHRDNITHLYGNRIDMIRAYIQNILDRIPEGENLLPPDSGLPEDPLIEPTSIRSAAYATAWSYGILNEYKDKLNNPPLSETDNTINRKRGHLAEKINLINEIYDKLIEAEHAKEASEGGSIVIDKLDRGIRTQLLPEEEAALKLIEIDEAMWQRITKSKLHLSSSEAFTKYAEHKFNQLAHIYYPKLGIEFVVNIYFSSEGFVKDLVFVKVQKKEALDSHATERDKPPQTAIAIIENSEVNSVVRVFLWLMKLLRSWRKK